mgnify:CR=1 FL=1
MTYKILVVDDEVMLTQLLSAHLADCGYLVFTANSGAEAMDKLRYQPDLILLDINMPGMDGLELCSAIRDHVSCPILFLTARITEQDKVVGLMSGGDDYITKPFGLNELTARIAAHLRRDARTKAMIKILTSGKLTVDLNQRTVSYEGADILMSRREFDILELLIQHPGQVFDRERIYEAVWGYDAEGDSVVVKEHIRKIRAKLLEATGQKYIETVWGVGYKWSK